MKIEMLVCCVTLEEHTNETLAALAASNGVVGDDHNGGQETKEYKIFLVYNRQDGKQYVCPAVADGAGFSINPIYLQDSQPRLSTTSVGGTVELKYGFIDGIEAHNRNVWRCGDIVAVVRF